MPTGAYYLILALSTVAVFFAVLRYRAQGGPIQLGLSLFCIAAYLALVIRFLRPPTALENKGTEGGPRFWATIAAILVCIIVGMLFEALYSWLGKTPAQRKKAFDWPGLIKPLCVSPLILIPTVGAFQNANIDLSTLGFAWVMILLTAFEKGFLWRHYMKRRDGDIRGDGR